MPNGHSNSSKPNSVTHFVGVPTMSWDLLEAPSFSTRDTSSLKSVGGGGAPMPPELVQRIEDNFPNGRPGLGYGMTETNAYGPQNAGTMFVENPTSTGKCVPVMDMRVTDPEGNELPTRRDGRDLVSWSDVDLGVLESPRCHRRDNAGRLAPDRRPRAPRRGGIRVRERPRQRHGASRRREHLLHRGRGGDLRTSSGLRNGRVRRAPRPVGGGTRLSRHGEAGGGPLRKLRRFRSSSPSASPSSRCRRSSPSLPSHSLATPAARSSSATCGMRSAHRSGSAQTSPLGAQLRMLLTSAKVLSRSVTRTPSAVPLMVNAGSSPVRNSAE